jgi:hypothetical protein
MSLCTEALNCTGSMNTVTPPRYRGHALVGGDGSDPGVYESSPVFSKEDQKRKAQHNKRHTWEMKRCRRKQENIAKVEEKRTAMAKALWILEDASLTFTDLCLHVFDPMSNAVTSGWRWENVYNKLEVLNEMLALLASEKHSKQASRNAERGMAKVVEKVVAREANIIMRKGVLRPPSEVDASFILGMKFSNLPDIIKNNCPTIFQVLMAIARTPRQQQECTAARLQHKSLVSFTQICM